MTKIAIVRMPRNKGGETVVVHFREDDNVNDKDTAQRAVGARNHTGTVLAFLKFDPTRIRFNNLVLRIFKLGVQLGRHGVTKREAKVTALS